MASLDWMAWSWQTGVLFGFIALSLIVVTIAAIRWPQAPRRGVLGFPTTCGDRLFLAFLGTAWIFVAWLRFADSDVLWWPAGISAAFWVLTFRLA